VITYWGRYRAFNFNTSADAKVKFEAVVQFKFRILLNGTDILDKLNIKASG
jgi:hypothetical protein